jgi:hypothetical protein
MLLWALGAAFIFAPAITTQVTYITAKVGFSLACKTLEFTYNVLAPYRGDPSKPL